MNDRNAGLRSRAGTGWVMPEPAPREKANGSLSLPLPAREREDTGRFALAFAAYRVELAGEGEIGHFHEIQVLHFTLLRDL